jgi:hypothetical protein
VTIPKATAWQGLRNLCLDTIPHGTSAHYRNALPLHEWRTKGSFQVLSCSSKEILLKANAIEIGTAFLSDSEHLLDHAAEQHASFKDLLSQPECHSPAWSVVTAYYWVFFSAMAIARLSGAGPWFLDRAAITDLKKLSPKANNQPAAGAQILQVGSYLDATERALRIRPSRAQLHQALWNRMAELFENGLDNSNEAANSLEYRLFRSLRDATKLLGKDWPIRTRNSVNYTPGRAYREVFKDPKINLASYLRKRLPFDCEKLVSCSEELLTLLRLKPLAADQLATRCNLLALYCVLLWMISRELLFEVVDRNVSDRRWQMLRSQFLVRTCPAPSGRIWPSAEGP